MILSLTPSAQEEIKKAIEESDLEGEVFLRVMIAGGGCSGFSYQILIENEKFEDDNLIEQGGIKVLVDKKSALFLEGTVLDYYKDISKRGFVFDNPNAVKSCGCGSSFQV